MTDSFALSKRGHSASAKKQVRRAGAVLAALLALVATSSSHLKAQAALRVLGPVDTSILGVHKFPLGIIDETGTSLAPCIDAFGAVPVCLLGSDLPNPGPASIPDNIPGEFFYSVADSEMRNVQDPNGGTPSVAAAFRFGVEASVDPITGAQAFFSRVRTRIKGGLVIGQFYRITHPYGVLEGQAVNVAGRGDLNVTEDLGCPPAIVVCDYAAILTTRTFPFLVWDGVGIPTPAGLIGMAGVPHTVTGSPFGTNFVRVERLSGPGGSPVATIANSARFMVAGKLIDFTPPTAAITAPVAGDVLGSVTVNATGADEPKGSGLASLKIMLDDVTTLASGATSPASAAWDTTTVPNGPHTLKAIATDVAGNVGTSAVVTVNVNNPVLVTVPNEVGQLQAAAAAAITAAHLVPAINTANDAVVPAGVVISQAPAGGASAVTGSTVTLLISLGPAVAPVGPSAVFITTDSATQGTWQGVYGADGYSLANGPASLPAYAAVTLSGQAPFTWVAATADVRALQRPGLTDRFAATWFSVTTFNIDVNLTDGLTHQVATYGLDWDSTRRAQRIDVLDAVSGAVLDTRTLTAFNAGKYLVWNLRGHVTLRVTRTAGDTSAISGLFFGAAGAVPPPPVAATAAFVRIDSATQGTWKGVYGADGFTMANGPASLPAFAAVTFSGQTPFTWVASTADVRALQRPAAADRFAATWFADAAFNIDVNLTDGLAHQVEVYGVDWDGFARSERIDVLDATSGAVLDTRTLTGFHGGQYAVWTLSGHVTLRVTRTGGNNAVISGVLFR